MLLFAVIIIMCLHPILRDLDKLDRDVQSIDVPLGKFDVCDYLDENFNSKATNLCVVQLNIRSISSKLSQLKHLIDTCVQNRTPNIIILCETWLTPFFSQIHIPDYDFCHKDCVAKCGGGVAFLILNRIRYKVQDNSKLTKATFESLTVELLSQNGNKLLASSIYQPLNTPENDFVDQYSNFVCSLKKREQNGIIIGLDHNLDLLKSAKTHQLIGS